MAARAGLKRGSAIALLLLPVLLAQCDRPPKFGTGPLHFRAFTGSSYWNTPLPRDAPVDPDSANIIQFLRTDNRPEHLTLAGAGRSGHWGNPIYWASSTSPTYRVITNCVQPAPAQFSSVRIPRGAGPDPTPDASMTVYDVEKGLVYGFYHTVHGGSDRWSSCGGTVYALESNGVAGSLPESNDARNIGHRGVPPPTYAVRFNEIKAGSIDHVLKISVNHTKCEHVFPMTGDECGTRAAFAPPEGTRIRIKPTLDLRTLDLSPAALIVAVALQRYGAVIGDQSGGGASLKLENTTAEGLGQIWDGVLTADSLAVIPLQNFEVVELGYNG
jgi:hypothetical protein